MAFFDPVTSELHRENARKRTHEGEASSKESSNKRPKLRGVWQNLDLILSLQSKDTPLQRKIELAFNFINSESANCNEKVLEPVSISRLVSFLSNWIQPVLISSENRSKFVDDFSDPCLDYRSWVLLKFCVEKKPSLSVSPNLLRSVTRVTRHAILKLEDCNLLFGSFLECISLIISSNSRSFYNGGVDLWITCIVENINLIRKVCAKERLDLSIGQVILGFSLCLLEQFSSFLRFYPNPKNVFRVFVDRLLDPLLELLILLHSLPNREKGEQFGNLLKIIEEILSNGLFHPSHISGFFSLKGEIGSIKGSYHKHLFQRFRGIKTENKAVLIAGFGHLFHLFVSRARSRKVTTFTGKSKEVSEEESNENKNPFFQVFVQFMDPLLLECKGYVKSEPCNLGPNKLIEIHCMIKSINETLSSFIKEKIYVRTEDTTEGSHFKFLKEVYDTLISILSVIFQFWRTKLQIEDVSVRKILPLIARELFVSIGNYLEIEYKTLGDNLVQVWQIMFGFLVLNLNLEDSKPSSVLVEEILSLGSRLINVFSELRQVNSPIFALFKAVRICGNTLDANRTADPFSMTNLHLPPQKFLESLETLPCSNSFRLSASSCIKSMPERQSSGFIEELKKDFLETLQWMRHSSESESDLKIEILGRVFSELYTTVLDSLTVTSSNSVLVGNSIENLVKEIRPSFSPLVKNENKNENGNGNDFISALTEGRMLNDESISWAMVFFFRLYSSSRSLYRQSISLMPPDSAEKMSESIGDLFLASCGTAWISKSKLMEEKSYFYWICNHSISLLDLIQGFSDSFFSANYVCHTPLVYALTLMSLQRLSDLNRQIGALKFVREEQENNPDLEKKSKKLGRKITGLKTEAVGLANFIAGNRHLYSLEKSQNQSQIGIWSLLCRNLDIWGLFASKEDLKEFFTLLIHYSLPLESENGESEIERKGAILHGISLDLLSSTILYDEPVLWKNFISRFCDVLEKGLPTLLSYSCTSTRTDLNLNLVLPDTSSGLNLVSCSEDYTEEREKEMVLFFNKELINCEGLLNLLCNIPLVQLNSKSFSRLVTCILQLERLVLSHILSYQDKSFTMKPLDFLNIFLSCRRALRYLVTSSKDQSSNSKSFSNFSKFFGNSSSLIWLTDTLNRLLGLPHNLFGENSLDPVKSVQFCLLDHTSQIFLKLSKFYSLFCFKNHEENSEELEICGTCVENMARILEYQIENLPLTEDNMKSGNLLCVMSCIQGFLWGLVAGSETYTDSSEFILWYGSKLSRYFNKFEIFMDIFLYLLLSDGNRGTVDLPYFDSNMGLINFDEITDLPLDRIFEFADLGRDLVKKLLKGDNPELGFLIRDLFISSGAILKLKFVLSLSNSNLNLYKGKIDISHMVLNEMAGMPGRPNKFSFVWIDGILRFLQILGSYLQNSNFTLSEEVYSQLINSHLRAIGKCISMQGKRESSSPGLGLSGLNAFISRVRVSLRKLISEPARSGVKTAVQSVERAIVGVEKGINSVYNVSIEKFESGKVSPFVAAGVDFLYLILDSLSGKERIFRKSVPSLVGSLFNIILHLESPKMFYIESELLDKNHKMELYPDPGAVVQMCVEALTTFAGRHSCPMDACHVAQCLNVPGTVFKAFHRARFSNSNGLVIDKTFSMDLYASCCKLIWTALKHRIREVGECVGILEESTAALLSCLEFNDSNLANSNSCFAWDMQETIKCATFLRRIYEEIRQQKDLLAKHAFNFLSTYINIYSGYGLFQTRIKREIDEALRPGVYSLIDICTPADLQKLHTVLGEGPRRSALATLLHDYKLRFQYEGKI